MGWKGCFEGKEAFGYICYMFKRYSKSFLQIKQFIGLPLPGFTFDQVTSQVTINKQTAS
jgi:hypothetical protein